MSQDGSQPPAAAQQVLTFMLGAGTYGIDIPRVQEIRAWSAATRLPRTQAHVLGVLNLRGAVVPVVDLRLCFGILQPAYTPFTVIIVLSVAFPGSLRTAGVVVDSVEEVISVAGADVRTAPGSGVPAADRFIRGLLPLPAHTVVLLDIETLMNEAMPRGAAHRAA